MLTALHTKGFIWAPSVCTLNKKFTQVEKIKVQGSLEEIEKPLLTVQVIIKLVHVLATDWHRTPRSTLQHCDTTEEFTS